VSEALKIQKLMSLSLPEFHKSVAVLAGADRSRDGMEVQLKEGAGTVVIRFEPLPPATLGGLLALPRARVTIDTGALDETQRRAFMSRFDLAFQRGGG
jgi:hypothetical protein